MGRQKYFTEEERIKARRESQRRYRQTHPDVQRRWYKLHPEVGREYSRRWQQENAEKYKDILLRRNYNISLEQYYTQLKQQGGVCAICGQPETAISRSGKVKDLAVDHCHGSNVVRGLLCGNCNTAIGLLRDDTAVLMRAIEYLLEAKGGRDGGTDDAEAANGN